MKLEINKKIKDALVAEKFKKEYFDDFKGMQHNFVNLVMSRTPNDSEMFSPFEEKVWTTRCIDAWGKVVGTHMLQAFQFK